MTPILPLCYPMPTTSKIYNSFFVLLYAPFSTLNALAVALILSYKQSITINLHIIT